MWEHVSVSGLLSLAILRHITAVFILDPVLLHVYIIFTMFMLWDITYAYINELFTVYEMFTLLLFVTLYNQ